MGIAILITAYILGCALAYYNFRKIIRRKQGRNWNVMERIIVVILSLYSWAIFIVFLIIVGLIMTNDINPDKEVKW